MNEISVLFQGKRSILDMLASAFWGNKRKKCAQTKDAALYCSLFLSGVALNKMFYLKKYFKDIKWKVNVINFVVFKFTVPY